MKMKSARDAITEVYGLFYRVLRLGNDNVFVQLHKRGGGGRGEFMKLI